MTVNPYLGADSLEPFLRHVDRGKGLYVLAKTSNPGALDLQDLRIAGPSPVGVGGADGNGQRPLYAHAAALAARAGEASIGARGFSSVGVVVGATHPEQARTLRAAHPSVPFLVPGYGAQGAGPAEVACAFDSRGRGAIVNASRSLLFAYRSERTRSSARRGGRRPPAASASRCATPFSPRWQGAPVARRSIRSAGSNRPI